MHDIDRILATPQHALGLAHERGTVRTVRSLRITRSFHPGRRL